MTLKVPLIAVGKVRIDFVALDDPYRSGGSLRFSLADLSASQTMPIVSLLTLVKMKLRAGRQKDIADLVELLKRGRIAVEKIDRHLKESAMDLVSQWNRVKALAAGEE